MPTQPKVLKPKHLILQKVHKGCVLKTPEMTQLDLDQPMFN